MLRGDFASSIKRVHDSSICSVVPGRTEKEIKMNLKKEINKYKRSISNGQQWREDEKKYYIKFNKKMANNNQMNNNNRWNWAEAI